MINKVNKTFQVMKIMFWKMYFVNTTILDYILTFVRNC